MTRCIDDFRCADGPADGCAKDRAGMRGGGRPMKKLRILPSMALKGIVGNGNVYYPYLAAGVFFGVYLFCVCVNPA